jgi:hypothetical protein
MVEQGDEKVIRDNSDLIKQIERRRDVEKQEFGGQRTETEGIIDIDDIENLAKNILNKDYATVNNVKLDNERLNNLIKKFKDSNKNASEEIKEIQFLLDRVSRKLTTEKTRLD